jgi:cell division protein FtsB
MKSFLRSKFATLVMLAVLGVVVFVTGKLLWQKYLVDEQIRSLQVRADQIRGQNSQLSDLVKYLNTPQYQEKQAREQLNLKKEGEVVVALPPSQQEQVASAGIVVRKSNPQKWYDYFFRKN